MKYPLKTFLTGTALALKLALSPADAAATETEKEVAVQVEDAESSVEEQSNEKSKLDIGTKTEAYATDGYGGLDTKMKMNFGNFLTESHVDIGSYNTNEFSVKDADLKAGYLTDSGFIALHGGLVSPVDAMKDTRFLKLQAGTRPDKHDFNILISGLLARAPYLVESYGNREPANIFGISLRGLLGKEAKINDKWKFVTNMDLMGSFFTSPNPSAAVRNSFAEYDVEYPFGEPSIFGLTHAFLKLESAFQNDKGIGIGLYNDSDFSGAFVHNHGLLFRLRNDIVDLDLISGVRGAHSLYEDEPHLISGNPIFSYGHRADLFAIAKLNMHIGNKAYAKAYADLNLTSQHYRVMGIVGFNVKDFDIFAKAAYDNYYGGLVSSLGFAWNFGRSKKFIAPEEERLYSPDISAQKPDIEKANAYPTNLDKLHEDYGVSLEEAMEKVVDDESLIDYMAHFNASEYRPDYTIGNITPQLAHSLGEGHCEPLNGVLGVYVLKHLGYKDAEFGTINAPAFYHTVALGRRGNGKITIVDYAMLYHTNQKYPEAAIFQVFPNSVLINGKPTPIGEKIQDMAETPILWSAEDYWK